MTLLGIALAALVGLSLGMLGGGGSILAVPIFVYVLGFETKQAIAMSLAVVGTTSLVGALRYWRRGDVNLRIAGIFGVVAMTGTYLGARLAVFVSGRTQLVLFALVMLAASVFMFRGKTSKQAVVDQVGAEPERGLRTPLLMLEGLAVGGLTGVVGVGGGFLIVPALVLLAKVGMKQAIGTSLLIIAMNSAAGLYGYVGEVVIPWAFTGLFASIAVAGIFAGTSLVRFVSQDALKRAFAIFLVFMGVFILYQNRGAFQAEPEPVTTREWKQ